MENRKNSINKRFYATLFVSLATLALLCVCMAFFMRAQIANELAVRINAARGISRDVNRELFNDLEILKNNILSAQNLKLKNDSEISNIYTVLIQNAARESKRFDAIFFVRAPGVENSAARSDDAASGADSVLGGPLSSSITQNNGSQNGAAQNKAAASGSASSNGASVLESDTDGAQSGGASQDANAAAQNGEEILSFYSRDARIKNLGEIKISNFTSDMKEGELVSRYMRIEGAWRYFLIKRVSTDEYLLGFADTNMLNSKLAGLGEILLFNGGGEIYNFSGNLFELLGPGFDLKSTGEAMFADINSSLSLIYFEEFSPSASVADSNLNGSELGGSLSDDLIYVMAIERASSCLNARNFMILALAAMFVLCIALGVWNFKFLKRRVLAPLVALKEALELSNDHAALRGISALEPAAPIDDIARKLDEILKPAVRHGDFSMSFKDALKYSSLSVLSIDNVAGTIESASNGARELYGDDVVGRNIFALQSGSFYDYAYQTQRANYAKENYVVTRHDTKDGVRDLYVKKSYVRDGSKISTLFVVLDASRYRKFYDETKQKYEYLNHAPIVTLVFDYTSGKIIDASKNIKEAWGYDAAQFLSGEIKFWDLLSGKDAQKARNEIINRLADMKSETQSFAQSYKIRHNDNVSYLYDVSAYAKKSAGTVAFYFQNIDESARALQRLQDDLDFYKTVIDTRNYSACLIDLEAQKISFDKNYLRILNYKGKSFNTEMSFGEFTYEIYYIDLENFNSMIRQCSAGLRDDFRCEFRLRNGENGYTWVSLQGYVTSNENGRGRVIKTTLEEIGSRKETELELNLNANVFSRSLEAILITDEAGKILRANNAFYEITGFGESETIGQEPNFFTLAQDGDLLEKIKQNLIGKRVSYKDEIYGLKKDGGTFPALFTAIAIKDDFSLVSNYILMFTEISQIKQKESELAKIAHHDALTGLPNRVYFMKAAQGYTANAGSSGKLMAVLFIDFDGFKAINDTYGHEVGDMFLQAISKAMSGLLRKGDILARLGGDEFGAIIGDLKDEQAAHMLLQRLLGISKMKFNLKGNEISASISVGAAFYDGSEKIDFSGLLSRADRAMYRAKTSGKNRYFIFENAPATDDEMSEAGLRQAIESGEFFVLYQPIISGAQIYGYELLLRWKRGSLGVLLPQDFFPIIGEPQLELLISKFAFSKMLEFNEQTGANCSINVSLTVLASDEFYGLVARRLRSAGERRGELMFEITDFSEQSYQSFIPVRKRYADLGIKFALNNANAQNVQFLANQPFDLIKIDRALCLNIGKKKDGIRAMVEITGKLKREFGFAVGAQGVENALSLRLLNNLKFNYLQGNFIAKALDRREIDAFIARFKDTPKLAAIDKDEFISFLNALDYKDLALSFIARSQTGELSPGEFESFKTKFGEILNKTQSAGSERFALTTEIRKQILDILSLDYRVLASFISGFRARLDQFISDLEAA